MRVVLTSATELVVVSNFFDRQLIRGNKDGSLVVLEILCEFWQLCGLVDYSCFFWRAPSVSKLAWHFQGIYAGLNEACLLRFAPLLIGTSPTYSCGAGWAG